jgi:hypothetical protein
LIARASERFNQPEESIGSSKLKDFLRFLKEKSLIESKYDRPNWDDVGQLFNL